MTNSRPWGPTMTDDLDTPAAPALDQRGEGAAAPALDQRGEELERRLEAILLVADEPLPIVTLATSLGAPVPAVRQSIERLVADYDGADGGTRRGFELREVGGGWRFYV